MEHFMEEKTTTFTLRIPEDLKKAFDMAAKAEDLSGAQVVRRFMRGYVDYYMKNHAQGDLLTPAKPTKRKK
jgi:predicted transcriptional regulator